MKRKWLRRNWLKIIEFLFGLPLAGFIFWGIVILARYDNWVAISALATMILAGAAFISVRQLNVNQKRERRERLLNKISQWATDIHNNFAPELFNELRNLEDRYTRRMYEDKLDPATCKKLLEEERISLLAAGLTTHEIRINELIIRSKYMSNISEVLDKDLHKQVYKLAVHLKARKYLIRKRYNSLRKDKKESEKWTARGGEHIKYLQKYCDDVLSTIGMLLTKGAT